MEEEFIKPRKVIHLLAEIKFSGAEVMLNLASDYFRQRNVELHVLSVGTKVGSYAEILEKSGFTIHHFPNQLSFSYFYSLYKFFRKNHFDAIHMHFEGAFFWYVTVIRLANLSASIIRTVHSVFPYRGYLRFRRIFQRYISRNLYNVTFVSIGSSVAEVEKKILMNQTSYVPNWIDKEKFAPLRDEAEKMQARLTLNIPEDSTLILSVGSCIELKNQKDILLALASIIPNSPNVYYMHVGDGPLRKGLIELAEELKIGANVKFGGQMENVRLALIASDVYVMPSEYEGLGMSLIEAMAIGLPSVVYNSYGLKDLIINGENGIVVEKNYRALGEGLLTLIKNQSLRTKYSVNARSYIKKNYNMDKSLSKLMKLYFPDYVEKERKTVLAK